LKARSAQTRRLEKIARRDGGIFHSLLEAREVEPLLHHRFEKWIFGVVIDGQNLRHAPVSGHADSDEIGLIRRCRATQQAMMHESQFTPEADKPTPRTSDEKWLTTSKLKLPPADRNCKLES